MDFYSSRQYIIVHSSPVAALQCKFESPHLPACIFRFHPAVFEEHNFHDQTSIPLTAGQGLLISQQSVISDPIIMSFKPELPEKKYNQLEGDEKQNLPSVHIFLFLNSVFSTSGFFFWKQDGESACSLISWLTLLLF